MTLVAESQKFCGGKLQCRGGSREVTVGDSGEFFVFFCRTPPYNLFPTERDIVPRTVEYASRAPLFFLNLIDKSTFELKRVNIGVSKSCISI